MKLNLEQAIKNALEKSMANIDLTRSIEKAVDNAVSSNRFTEKIENKLTDYIEDKIEDYLDDAIEEWFDDGGVDDYEVERAVERYVNENADISEHELDEAVWRCVDDLDSKVTNKLENIVEDRIDNALDNAIENFIENAIE